MFSTCNKLQAFSYKISIFTNKGNYVSNGAYSNIWYDFVYKLFNVALPRVRDFRGISKNSFDGRGNYTLGIKEQLVFPEVEYDQVIKVRGLDIVIVTTANTNEEALALLTEFGLPFRK